mmetsp:Transcript_14766/g.37552  ORF Transcript_14766/g.37552 Transcript_14766/m.37552 type:complete len:425 (+) Transcript_14766:849-2123(+)
MTCTEAGISFKQITSEGLIPADVCPQSTLTLRGGFELKAGRNAKKTITIRRPAARSAKKKAKTRSDVIAGALARAASQSTIHPLDTIKVQMQAGTFGSSVSKYGKLVPPTIGANVASNVAGVASLYRGVVGAASGAGIAIGAYFALYSSTTKAIEKRFKSMSPGAVAFAAGAIAAAGGSLVKVPLAVCIRSVQAGVYPNVFRASKQIVQAAGARGLFTGFLPTFLEDVPDMAVKFAAYESLRQLHCRIHNGKTSTPQEDLVMGGVSGSLAAAATTPLDVIKTRMMCSAAARPTVMNATRGIISEGQGLRAFFTGVGPRALSNGVNTAVFFCFFEAIKSAVEAFEARTAKERMSKMQARQNPGSGGDGGNATTATAIPGDSVGVGPDLSQLDDAFEFASGPEGHLAPMGASMSSAAVNQQISSKR